MNAMEERRQTRASLHQIRYGRPSRTVLVLLLSILPVLPALAQNTQNTQDAQNAQDQSKGTADTPEASLKPAVVRYEPSNRRDPFFHITPSKTVAEPEDMEIERGERPSGIGGTFIDEADVKGIVIRSDNLRMAVVLGDDKRAYFLREGDRLFDGYIQSIENDSVVFVRETFMRSGKTVTEEITKRLRKS